GCVVSVLEEGLRLLQDRVVRVRRGGHRRRSLPGRGRGIDKTPGAFSIGPGRRPLPYPSLERIRTSDGVHPSRPALEPGTRLAKPENRPIWRRPMIPLKRDAGLAALVESESLETLAGGFQFTEGPLGMPDDSVLFQDIKAERTYRLAPDRTLTV